MIGSDRIGYAALGCAAARGKGMGYVTSATRGTGRAAPCQPCVPRPQHLKVGQLWSLLPRPRHGGAARDFSFCFSFSSFSTRSSTREYNKMSTTAKRLASGELASRIRLAASYVSESLGLRAYSTQHKATTGIVGLPMLAGARDELARKVDDVMRALDAHGIPKTASYRKAVEQKCGALLDGLRTQQNDEELERAFGRQLEEEVKLCEDELRLIPKMADWKPWVGGGAINVVEDGSGEQVTTT